MKYGLFSAEFDEGPKRRLNSVIVKNLFIAIGRMPVIALNQLEDIL